MASLAVDKIKKKVNLSLSDGVQYAGFFFLSPFSETGSGRETLLDLLGGRERFIPFETGEGQVYFLNNDHIVWVASAREPDEHEASVPPDRRNVTVHLADGKRLRGDVVMALPDEKSRLSDWLNELSKFMVLRDEKREVLINVNYVVKIG
ncbi:MAG: hypothetical protein KKB20_25330 [Proteobacteria bacterium]|nr:hypothetical protein [Pseudomonadota bacterium]